MNYILLYRGNNGYAKAPQCYFYLYNTGLVLFTLGEVVIIILHSDTTVATILLFLLAPRLYL